MKKILSAFAAVIFAAITLTSCGGNEVDKVAAIFNNAAEKISALTPGDTEGLQAIGEASQKELEQYKDSTLELTDADRKTLAKAAMNLTFATYKLYGMSNELSDEEKSQLVDQIAEELNEFKTLGDALKAF